jgi:hypothetical protein
VIGNGAPVMKIAAGGIGEDLPKYRHRVGDAGRSGRASKLYRRSSAHIGLLSAFLSKRLMSAKLLDAESIDPHQRQQQASEYD